jgi:hypothetical protein
MENTGSFALNEIEDIEGFQDSRPSQSTEYPVPLAQREWPGQIKNNDALSFPLPMSRFMVNSVMRISGANR